MVAVGNKILMVCAQEILLERNDGGKKASYRVYELIRKVFGEENVTLCMYSNYAGEIKEKNIIRAEGHKNQILKSFNVMRGHLFTNAKEELQVVDLIEKNDIDIVLLDRSMHGKLAMVLKERKLKCKIWVFMHNIEKNYFINKVKHQNMMMFFPYLAVAKSEKETIACADYIMGLTERDAKEVKRLYGKEMAKILPMSFYDIFEKERWEQKSGKREILFVGTLFPQNYDGIKWFIINVMPELENVSLKIVGKNFEKKRKELEKKNVEVIGTVNDLSTYYYRQNIVVLPILYGDGIKVKTAEAMMYGKIIVATDEALNGYEVDGVSGIFRCNKKEEFIKCINETFGKHETYYSENVRKCFQEKYCLDKQIEECKKEWLKSEKV